MLTITLICELLALGGLLALSAFFSGTEIALFSLSKLQLRRLRQEHPAQGQIISELLDQPHRLLSTILFGNTLVNVGAAILGYAILQTLTPQHAEALAVPVMTIMILLGGEVTPKTLVIRSAEFFAIHLARPIQWTVASTLYVRRVAEALSAVIVQAIDRLPFFANQKVRSTAPTEDEYRTLLTISERAGVVRKEERYMVNKILALENMLVKEIMTPRVDMQCVDDSLPPGEMAAVLRHIKHRRVPIIHDTPDKVEGILKVKDFLINPEGELDEVVELPNFVPETIPVAKLLKSFRKQEHPVAIVVDEYGGTQGMVTLEDILEEIVGEIEDEFDKSEIMVQKLDEGRFLINGKARLELVNEQCALALQAPDVETIAGWVIAQLGALPKEGEQVRFENVRATARKVLKNRVGEVLLECVEMDVLRDLFLIVMGIAGSAFFSGVETGLISLNRVRLRHEVERKGRRALIINGFVENTERLLGTTLLGNSLANVLVGVYASLLVRDLLGRYNVWTNLAATLVASAVLLVVGEIVPKSLFRRYPHRLCMLVADALNAVAWLFAPIVALLGFAMRAIVRVSGATETPKSFFVTREELKHLAKEGEAGGALSAEEREMIDGVFDFPYKTVYDVMLPIARTVTVFRDTVVSDVFEVSQRTGFARFPVREGDKIVGIVNVYEILFERTGYGDQTAGQLMQKPQFVASTERINRVLPVLRAGRHPISIVVSPEGKHEGILTIEDIVEEIVGDVEG